MAAMAATVAAAIKSFLCIKTPPSFYALRRMRQRSSAGGLAAGGVGWTGKNTGDKIAGVTPGAELS
jgi:hypothetical protein